MFKRLLLAALASVAFAGVEACTVEEVITCDTAYFGGIEIIICT
jgi:hypothetical protein